jgi:hypothetical protein
MHIDRRGGTASGARSVRRICRLANSRVALVAGASLIAAFAFGAPGLALAACGTGIPTTGAHAPSAGSGGVHSGTTAPHVSAPSGGSSCPTTVIAKPTPLAGVHEPGEAPRHMSLAGVHTLHHSTSNTNNGHLPRRPAANGTLPKP